MILSRKGEAADAVAMLEKARCPQAARSLTDEQGGCLAAPGG